MPVMLLGQELNSFEEIGHLRDAGIRTKWR
jgi:hypothetical protein